MLRRKPAPKATSCVNQTTHLSKFLTKFGLAGVAFMVIVLTALLPSNRLLRNFRQPINQITPITIPAMSTPCTSGVHLLAFWHVRISRAPTQQCTLRGWHAGLPLADVASPEGRTLALDAAHPPRTNNQQLPAGVLHSDFLTLASAYGEDDAPPRAGYDACMPGLSLPASTSPLCDGAYKAEVNASGVLRLTLLTEASYRKDDAENDFFGDLKPCRAMNLSGLLIGAAPSPPASLLYPMR
jgi:hypothetical protein